MKRGFSSILLIGLLASCGGGAGGGGNPPPAGNQPPSFTSAATANAAENSAGTVYQATATDPDGNPLSFSLAGGADQGRFTITAGGALSFTTPPDFEAPADADSNNVYQVTLQVSDGFTSATLNLAVTVTNAGPDGFRVARIGTGFDRPVFVAPVPDGSGRVFVVQQTGLIRILNPATGTVAATPFLNVTAQTTTDGERGLLGFATAPDFATSGTFYIFLTNAAGSLEIRRYRTLAGNRDQADPATADLLLSIPHPAFNNHNGGWIGFGPDGFLYVATGDGGAAAIR